MTPSSPPTPPGRKIEFLVARPAAEKVQEFIHEGITALLAGETGSPDFLKTEILNSCKDGSLRWVEISYGIRRNVSTGEIEVVGASWDTAERRRNEDALRSSEAKFRGLFEANRDAVLLADERAVFLDANPAAVALYGCSSKEELLHLRPDSTSPQLQPCGDPSAARALQFHNRALQGETLTFDWVIRRMDNGKNVECEVTLTPVEIEGKRSVLATIHDLTEKKQAEAELRLSEERHRLLAEHARDVIWTMELDGTISYVSPSVEKVRGFTPEECLKHSLDETLIPESQPGVISYLQQLQAAVAAGRRPETFRGEQGYLRKDGSIFWADVIAFPLLRGDGSFVQLIGMSRDISAFRLMQEAMQEARDAADSANRAKSEFLANMSHEIRTPMNAVIGLSNLLREAIVDEAQRSYAGQIHQAGTALLGVLDDILDYSRIEAGQMKIEEAVLRIGEVLDNCRVLFTADPALQKVELLFDVAPAVPPVLMGDPLRLLQIIKNLVGNAIKFTRQGFVRVGVELLEESTRDVLLKVTVRDTGIGLSPEQIEKIFEAFHQGDISTTRRFGGTGLGLSISKRLVGLMGGEIGVDSEQGRGSTFWFTACLSKATGAGVAEARSSAPRKSFSELQPVVAPIRGARVLVVDDSPTNLLVAEQYLLKLGIVVEKANNGRQAVEKATRERFDAILMDLQMPDMDGFVATALIRKAAIMSRDPQGSVPVIALSAAAMPADIQACLEAGMDAHISKPINPGILAETLVRWIPPRSKEEGVGKDTG